MLQSERDTVTEPRGKSDRNVIVAMLCICDSHFQQELMEKAKRAGKLEVDFTIPLAFTTNTPEKLATVYNDEKRLKPLPY